MNDIHDTAIIHHNAKLGNNVVVGPFCIIGEHVTIGDNVNIKSHVIIEGKTTIGNNNIIYPFSSLGQVPQDLKYRGEDSEVIIGDNNVIREYVTIQSGTEGGIMLTKVGNNCLFMVGVHIAHDCIVGNNVIMANYASLAGHVEVGDYAILGGLSAVGQFVRVGNNTMLGGLSGLNRDLIPYGLANNERANLEGINLVGMKRKGLNIKDSLDASQAVKEIFSIEGNFEERIKRVTNKYSDNNIVQEIISFITQDAKKSFCQFKKE